MQCPLKVPVLMHAAISRPNIGMLDWLRSNTAAAEWTADLIERLFESAAVSGAIKSLQWLRDNGAEWPARFVLPASNCYERKQLWATSSIQWALDNGSSWRDWQCSDLEANIFACSKCKNNVDNTCRDPTCRKQKALDLFAWAHAKGCPCTCSSSAAPTTATAAV
jgi:hypothetical protein